jgi:cytochrome bd-type quinol oxidase subunit 2
MIEVTKMNKCLSLTSLVASIVFCIIMAIAYSGVEFTLIATSIIDIFIIPFYILIIVSFVFTLIKWHNEKNNITFRYLLYSSISFILTCGILVYTIYQYSITMSNFD